MTKRVLAVLLLLALSSSSPGTAREQSGRAYAVIGAETITVYTYRPAPCPHPKLLVVFAGFHRDADRYRDRARGLADRACLLVIAPLLDTKRYPSWRYQRGGIAHDGVVQPESEWTGPLLMKLISWGRAWTGQRDIPYLLFGHSAGAQLLSRFAAYTPPADADRIVIANPSAHVWPSVDELAPYGFGGVFDAQTRETHLRAYLALPITIYLGTADTDTEDKLLLKDAPSERQGATRYERGLNVFRAASNLSHERSWRFGWRLVEVPNSGHSSGNMLNADQAMEAFGLVAPQPVH